ncbi:MAG: hypothetical protein KY445_10880 [Armatimonadetes bacterium]|nr:hypothetical protein [Armatimonadota bacterium]
MWLALTLISFVSFLASMLALARRGFTRDGQFRRAGAVLVAVAVFSALVWVWSLSKVPPPYPIEKTRRYEAPNF